MSNEILSQKKKKVIAGPKKFARLVKNLGESILKAHPELERVALIGIQTGGTPLTQRLCEFFKERLNITPPTGFLDITLYRDDWTSISSQPRLKKTDISFPIDDKVIILVDDVIYTGRTIRAALDALIDLGRPKKIELAVLVDRGGRELPIEPNYVSLRVKKIEPDEYVSVYFKELSGKDQICLERY